MSERKEGWYHVKRDGVWIISDYSPESAWLVDGHKVTDSYFSEINETRILMPDEENEDNIAFLLRRLIEQGKNFRFDAATKVITYDTPVQVVASILSVGFDDFKKQTIQKIADRLEVPVEEFTKDIPKADDEKQTFLNTSFGERYEPTENNLPKYQGPPPPEPINNDDLRAYNRHFSIDYTDLLKRYINHVRQTEGTDFVDRCNESMSSDIGFTKLEIEALNSLK